MVFFRVRNRLTIGGWSEYTKTHSRLMLRFSCCTWTEWSDTLDSVWHNMSDRGSWVETHWEKKVSFFSYGRLSSIALRRTTTQFTSACFCSPTSRVSSVHSHRFMRTFDKRWTPSTKTVTHVSFRCVLLPACSLPFLILLPILFMEMPMYGNFRQKSKFTEWQRYCECKTFYFCISVYLSRIFRVSSVPRSSVGTISSRDEWPRKLTSSLRCLAI